MRRAMTAALLIWLSMRPAEASAQLFPPSFPSSDPAPATQPAPVLSSPDFSAFAGGWWQHGFGLAINPDGSGEASWRVYTWCNSPRTVQPCDGMQGNMIINGGHAVLSFDRIDSQTAFGNVIDSSDQKTLPKGAIRFTLREYGLGELTSPDAGTSSTVLCGPHFLESPDWFQNTHPCGA